MWWMFIILLLGALLTLLGAISVEEISGRDMLSF